MLAEIFMVRLEAAARALKETVPSSIRGSYPSTPTANLHLNKA
jgi:hypothetical protein